MPTPKRKKYNVKIRSLTGDRETLELLCNHLQMSPTQVSRLARVLYGAHPLVSEFRKERFTLPPPKPFVSLGYADQHDLDHIRRLRSRLRKNTSAVMTRAYAYLAKLTGAPIDDIPSDPRRFMR